MLIYEPKGRAREYSPLALNVYKGGCDHGCIYCYCKTIPGMKWSTTPIAKSQDSLHREAKKASRQVLLSFVGDPYCVAEVDCRATLRALEILQEEGCTVAVLTKGGLRCMRDRGLFRCWPGGRIKVGASVTMLKLRTDIYEPFAAPPAERLEVLGSLHELGVKTWLSIEAVIDKDESLSIISDSLPYVDTYMIGKMNHAELILTHHPFRCVDWERFGIEAVTILREAGKSFYVKSDLRQFLTLGFLKAEEKDPENVTLPDRPFGDILQWAS